MRCWFLLLALSAPFSAPAQRPPLVVPSDPAAIVEQLPAGYAELMPRPEAQATAPAALPAQIARLLATAASTGDARLVARAEALLASLPPGRDSPALLHARAYAAQYRHDFPAALELLDRAIERDPRAGDARLARAQILLVQGRLERARNECAALALGVDMDRGVLCAAAVALRSGQTDGAASVLDRWLDRGAGAGAETRRHALVIRAEAASRGGDADADRWFRQALALAPGDVRTLAAYSRHLRAADRPREAVALLADAPATDHLALERALAARTAGHPEAGAMSEALARRFQLARSLGIEPDLRDEAEFLLSLRGNPDAALALAQRNFAEQRDYEDVSLLRRAALAAGRPEALQDLHAWSQSQQIELAPLHGEAR